MGIAFVAIMAVLTAGSVATKPGKQVQRAEVNALQMELVEVPMCSKTIIDRCMQKGG